MDPTVTSQSQQPRPPARRRVRRFLLSGGVALATAVFVVHFVVMPWIVRRSFKEAFSGLGFPDAAFDVKRALLWRSTVTNLTASDGSIRAASIDVTYHPFEVIHGQLERITIDGAKVAAPLRRRDAAASADGQGLPFQELIINNVTVELPTGPQPPGPGGVLSLEGNARLTSDSTGWRAEARIGSGKRAVMFNTPTTAVNLGPLHLSGTASAPAGQPVAIESTLAIAGLSIPVRGSLEPGAAGLDGRISAHVPAAQLDDATAVASRFSMLAGWTITGTFACDAELRFQQGRPSGYVTLTVADADVAASEADVELRGMNGGLTVNFGETISTPPGQTFRAARAAFPKVEMTDLSLTFQLASPDALIVQHLAGDWLGGRVSTSDVQIDPADPKFEANLVAERLSLRHLLELAAPGRATGEGLISGEFAINVDWPDNITFGKGMLRSVSRGGGELQVLDTQWLGQALDQSDPRFTAAGELALVKDRVLSALADFSYERLSFNFEEEPVEEGGLLRVHTYGRGRVGERPQEIGLTLNFRGINKLIRPALRMREWWNQLTNPELN